MGRSNLTPQEIELKKTISSNLNNFLLLNNKRKIDIHKVTKIPKSTISDYFAGNTLPSEENVEKLATFFNVPNYEIDPRFKKADHSNDIDDGKLENMLSNARSFEGNIITDNDKELLKDWLKIYYKSKSEN